MGFLDSIKDSAGRAAFEADRKVRLARVESGLGALKKTMSSQFTQLGEATYSIFRQQALVDQGLAGLCEQIRSTERQMEEAQAEAAKIRLEAAPAAGGLLLFGRVCLQCQIRLPEEAVFCPRCGGPATDVTPPAPANLRPCPSCGKAVAQEAKFCPACGALMEAPLKSEESEDDPATTTATEVKCPSCGQILPAGAVFCSACGTSVK